MLTNPLVPYDLCVSVPISGLLCFHASLCGPSFEALLSRWRAPKEEQDTDSTLGCGWDLHEDKAGVVEEVVGVSCSRIGDTEDSEASSSRGGDSGHENAGVELEENIQQP